ncbi:MAG: carboxypeptidase regulatory-like domain-containing protein [Planctomyces sp.]
MNLRLTTIFSAFMTAGLIGCGQFGGGASVVPEVSFVPADLGAATEAAAEEAETTESAASAAGPGNFSGRVMLSGAAPSLPMLIAKGADVKDKEVCAATDIPDERLVLSADGGVANVFVYLAKAPKGGTAPEATEEAVIFDQKNCRFLPHALIVPTGRTVKILSDDPIAHNTHTYPSKNDSINSGVAPNDREGILSFVYKRAEAVPLAVSCDYHGWMKAWHLPIDHPYAAVTDENGNFSIPNLPSGKHSFVVWHESVQGNFVQRKLSVTVNPGETTEMKIDMPVASLAIK